MVTTIRLYYDAAVAVALMAVAAIVCGLVAAIMTGGSHFPVVTIAFVLMCGFMYFRLRRNLRTLAHDS